MLFLWQLSHITVHYHQFWTSRSYAYLGFSSCDNGFWLMLSHSYCERKTSGCFNLMLLPDNYAALVREVIFIWFLPSPVSTRKIWLSNNVNIFKDCHEFPLGICSVKNGCCLPMFWVGGQKADLSDVTCRLSSSVEQHIRNVATIPKNWAAGICTSTPPKNTTKIWRHGSGTVLKYFDTMVYKIIQMQSVSTPI